MMLSYEELESRIIQSGICTVCGACISACPLYYIQLIDGAPKRPKKKAACKNCGTCFDSCYKIPGEYNSKGIGSYLRTISAKWNRGTACQDGGIVTALLTTALEMDRIDGALLTIGEGLIPLPYVAKTADDISASAGTKFGVSPLLAKLRSAIVEHGLNRLAIVGTPCHIQAVRHLQNIDQELSSAVILTIGLFCSENFDYHSVEDQIQRNLLKDIDRLTVSNGKFSIKAGDETVLIPVSEMKHWVLDHCFSCKDYASELADISIGSEGSPAGWSTVVIRTQIGDTIFSELERLDDMRISVFTDAEVHNLTEISENKRIRAETERRKSLFLLPQLKDLLS